MRNGKREKAKERIRLENGNVPANEGVKRFDERRNGLFRTAFTLICGLFCLGSLVKFLYDDDVLSVLLAAVTLLLVCVPSIIEHFLSMRMSTSFYVFVLLYAIGSLLGDGYKFYHLTTWWDKLMHASAGVVFAVVGASLPALLNKGESCSPAMRAAFAFCFSLTISALWEFFEFGMDRIFGMDMQHDTLITWISSYILGDDVGMVGSISGIESVLVNGRELSGYIDIGLIDTMFDMMFEGIGALICSLIYCFDKHRGPALEMKSDADGKQ